MEDHIVEEVRRVRDEHAAQFDYNLDAIVADLKRSEAARDWPKVSFGPRRVQPIVPVDVTAAPVTPNK